MRKYERPFFVRSVWHDGQFTYIKADATELPALYEVKDGSPALVNFQVEHGTLRRAEGHRSRISGARARRASSSSRNGESWPNRPPALHPSRITARPRAACLPRGAQTWLMAALAFGLLAIIVVTGRPEPAGAAGDNAVSQAACGAQSRSPARLSGPSSRARRAEPSTGPGRTPSRRRRRCSMRTPERPGVDPARGGEATSGVPEPVCQQRRGQPSDRTASSRSSTGDGHRPARRSEGRDRAAVSAEPRRGRRRGHARHRALSASGSRLPQAASHAAAQDNQSRGDNDVPVASPTEPIQSPLGPTHRLLEGTFIDAVLTNRLDGTSAAPVNCLVTNPVYSHSGQHIVIPAGARVLGQTTPVQSLGETRLAVSFHRLVLPDGSTYPLDQFMGLNQIGDAGLRDRVNQHYLSTFGAAAAVGLITGLSQFVGTAGFGRADANRTVVIAGGIGDATGQATAQVMQRFLNRLPTITIREGHRVKVYLTSDIELPAYEPGRTPSRIPVGDASCATLLPPDCLSSRSPPRCAPSWSSSILRISRRPF